MQTHRPDPGNDLWERMLLHWRMRCVLRGAPIDATSGPAATDLCAAVVRTLESGSQDPELARAARLWAGTVASGAGARDALQYLAEVASELAAAAFDKFPTAGLGAVIELLAAEARAAIRPPDEPTSSVTMRGLPDRKALLSDLAAAGARSEASSMALAVVEVASARQSRSLVHRRHQWELESHVRLVAGALQRAVANDAVYRLGRNKLAVLAPGTTAMAMGPMMLRATCAAPRAQMSWGVAGGRAAVVEGQSDPEVLLILAEADLLLRRRDLVHAQRALARHRRRTALAAPAAALALLTGVVAGLTGTTGAPGPSPRLALVPARTVPHVPARGSSAGEQPQTPAPQPQPAPGQAPRSQPPGPPTVQTVSAVVNSPAPSAPAGYVPSAVPPTTPPAVVPPPSPSAGPPPPPVGASHGSHGKPTAPPGNPTAPGKGHSGGTPV